MMVIAVKNIRRYNAFKWEYKSAQESLTEELWLNKKYHRQLAEINTADFWELEAKEQLGYVRKGEVVYKLLPTTHKH